LRVAAVADVHSPRYLAEFRESLSKCDAPDLLLLAGDMIDSGKVSEYGNIIDAIDSHFGSRIPIVACFGNDENEEVRPDILRFLGDRVTFLDEQAFRVDLKVATVGIVGAPTLIGSDERPRSRGVRAIGKVFEKRIENLSRLLTEAAKTCIYTILLMHYCPLLETENGTHPDAFSWWVSKAVQNAEPDVIVYGHVHVSARPATRIGQIRAVNVALPAVGRMTELQL